jgi:hypothetical protein
MYPFHFFSSMYLRLVLDSLPGAGHPKLRKVELLSPTYTFAHALTTYPQTRQNFKAVLRVTQEFCHRLPWQRGTMAAWLLRKLAFVHIVVLAASAWLAAFNASHCEQCDIVNAPDNPLADVCPYEGTQAVTCSWLFHLLLLLTSVVFQLGAMLVFAYCYNQRAVKPNKLAFGNMEDCLQSDTNWKRVIGATSYAGMLFGWGTFVFFSSISDRGLNFGLKTWLIVSSSQSLFYGLLWCFVHGCIVFRHSIVFVWQWTRPSLCSGWLLRVRQLITVTLLTSTLLFLYLASWLYSGVFVTYLAFVLGSIFSVVTFLGYQSYKLLLPSSPLLATICPFPSPFPSARRLAQSKIAETSDGHASPVGTRRQASALPDINSPVEMGRSVSGAEEALYNPSRISRFMMYVSFASLLMIVIGVTLLAVAVRMLVFPEQVPNTWYHYHTYLHHLITTTT